MSQLGLVVETPDGRRHEIKEDLKGDLLLSDCLERAGFPLNTRCRGRGVCRGCQVTVGESSLRACQTLLGELDTGDNPIRIPPGSLRDRRLNGVQVFDVTEDGPPHRPRAGIGLAMDLGTTTLAAALWDLERGVCLGTASTANEQRRYGDNVLSRIDHAVAKGHSRDLQEALVHHSFGPMLSELYATAGIDANQVSEAEAAGNTIMLHTLAGEPLDGFAAYPFHPVFLKAQSYDAAAIGFEGHFELRSAPNPGPFVGADITMGAIASGMHRLKEPALLIDFGTNGEILLNTGDTLLATATAAGPAFEGGRLLCGATAGPGVISSLTRRESTWVPRWVETEHEHPPTGISGAAYIDFLALALEEGLVNEAGRFRDKTVSRGTDHDSGSWMTIVGGLCICEADVAELIQAKAAIGAGVMSLLETAGLKASDLKHVFVAGGFGYHLNPVHGMRVGLLPTVPAERIHIIGNASLGGASLRLLAGSDAGAAALCARCRVVELNQADDFEDHFIDSMTLSPLGQPLS